MPRIRTGTVPLRAGRIRRPRVELATPSPVELLRAATWWIDATDASASTQEIVNRGTGGAALNAMVGSTTGVDSNDPTFLPYTGTPYVYLPGVAGNYLSVPDAASLDIVGDIDIRVKVALDDWTPPSSTNVLINSYDYGGQARWAFRVLVTGTLQFEWFNSSVVNTTKVSSVVTGLTDGSAKWLRATLDVDNGASGSDVKFWMSDDGVAWSQLGTTQTTAGTTNVRETAGSVIVGGENAGATTPPSGKFYRAQVYAGLDGTDKRLDIDTSILTSGAATSFTAATGQTVTINRSTSGRKSVAVVAPCWLFGIDDYMEVADNDLLDFGASDSFTVLVAHRSWATFGTNDALLAKKADTTEATAGWALTAGSSTAAQGQLQAGDGTAGATAVSGSRTSGALTVVAGVRNVAADTLTVYLNGTAGTPVTDASTGSLANAGVMRVGRLSGAGTEYADTTLHATAVWRRVLTAAEIAALATCFVSRVGA